MEKALTQTTRPGETYIELGHKIKKMNSGDQMPSFSVLLKELEITQRSLDIAYKQLEADGAVEIKKQHGVFVKNPYAGGTFLFVAAEDLFLSQFKGQNLRFYFAQIRRRLQHLFPGARLELYLTESPDYEHYNREPQLRDYLYRTNRLKRICGVFVSYHITEPETHQVFKELSIPSVDVQGDDLRINDGAYDAETMIEFLERQGKKDIIFLCSYSLDYPGVEPVLRKHPKVRYEHIDTAKNLIENGIHYIHQLLDNGALPEAFAVQDDYFCQGLLMGAYMRGMILEKECAIVSISQKGQQIPSRNPITCLNYDWGEIANAALTVMQQKLKGQWCNQFLTVRPSLEISSPDNH